MRWWTGVLLGVLLGTGVAVAQTSPSDAPAKADTTTLVTQGQYVLGVGDRLRVTYYQDVSFDETAKVTETRIGEDGTILLPLVGRINAAGKTPDEIQNEVHKRLSRYIESPVVYVEVLDYQSLSAILLGATVNQGLFPIAPNMTITQFLAANSGIAPNGDFERVSVLRGNGDRILLNLSSYFESGVTSQDILMQPGDVVFVPYKTEPLLTRISRALQIVILILQSIILAIVLTSK